MINAIVDIIETGVGYFKERRQAKHEVKMATLRNRQRLAQDKQSNNHEWEMANLESNDRLLRIVSFTMFSVPMVVTVIWPETGKQIFTNLDQAPEWYVQTFIAINGGVWGIVELKHAAPQFVNGLRQVFKRGEKNAN